MNSLGRFIFMTRAQRIADFGKELRLRRENAGYDAKQFAAKIKISSQHLSQLETAYTRPGRPPVGPGDDVVESISAALGWRVIEIRRMLGQIPEDEEITYEIDPDALRIAERYSGLPSSLQRMVDGTIKSAEEMALEIERSGSIGKRAE